MTDTIYTVLIYPIIFILPAWIANGAPVIFGGGEPLDFGKRFGKKRIFGKHKTIRGTIAGIGAGIITAALVSLFFPFLFITGVALSFGAVAGDLIGSFVKRRMNIKEGQSVLLMDQYGFFVVALLVALPYGSFPGYLGLIAIAILTGMLHVGMNMMAHKAGVKKVPW